MGPLDNPAFQSRLRSLFASFATDGAHYRSLGASVLFALGDRGRAIDNRIEVDPAAPLELSSMAGSALGRSAPLEQTDDERMTDPAAPWNWSVLWRARPLAVLLPTISEKLTPPLPWSLVLWRARPLAALLPWSK